MWLRTLFRHVDVVTGRAPLLQRLQEFLRLHLHKDCLENEFVMEVVFLFHLNKIISFSIVKA